MHKFVFTIIFSGFLVSNLPAQERANVAERINQIMSKVDPNDDGKSLELAKREIEKLKREQGSVPRIPLEERNKALATKLGLNPKHPYLAGGNKASAYFFNKRNQGYTPQVKKHFRGNAGIFLPTPEELDRVNSIELTPQLEQHFKDQAKRDEYEQEELLSKEIADAEPLESCSFSSTERIEAGPENADPLKRVLFDLLILPDQKIEDDPLKLFGKTVGVLEAAGEDRGLAYSVAQSSQFKCLPGRVRITKEFVFIHHGVDALKNYDEDPFGNGKLDPSLDRYKRLYNGN